MSESIVVDEAPLQGEPITETQDEQVTQEVQNEETQQPEPEFLQSMLVNPWKMLLRCSKKLNH